MIGVFLMLAGLICWWLASMVPVRPVDLHPCNECECAIDDLRGDCAACGTRLEAVR